MRAVFTPFDAKAVLQIPLCTRRVSDFWAWSEEPRGYFLVSSTYRMLVRTKLNRQAWLEGRKGTSNVEAEGVDWKSLWKLQVP